MTKCENIQHIKRANEEKNETNKKIVDAAQFVSECIFHKFNEVFNCSCKLNERQFYPAVRRAS